MPCSAGSLSDLTFQAVHLYEDKAKGASLLISRTNSSFSVRGVLGPDRAIRPRPDSAAPPLPTRGDTTGHQIPDGSLEIDPSSCGSAQNIPPHWVTTANHPLPGTDYQVNTKSRNKHEYNFFRRWKMEVPVEVVAREGHLCLPQFTQRFLSLLTMSSSEGWIGTSQRPKAMLSPFSMLST